MISTAQNTVFHCVHILMHSYDNEKRNMLKQEILDLIVQGPPTHIDAFQTNIFHDLMTLYVIHGLRTPNKGLNQRYLKNWADVADKICFGRT